MIVDSLKNARLYYNLSDRLAKGLKYLQETDFSKMEPGRYEIDGANVYAMVQQYDSIPIENCRWEAHRRYIDIQYIVDGIEKMGYANIKNMKEVEYQEAKDFVLMQGNGDFVTVEAGMFAVFMPEDVHAPCIAVDTPKPVKKVVVKVLY